MNCRLLSLMAILYGSLTLATTSCLSAMSLTESSVEEETELPERSDAELTATRRTRWLVLRRHGSGSDAAAAVPIQSRVSAIRHHCVCTGHRLPNGLCAPLLC